jgi:RNA polymerase-binding protein DksA
MADLTPRDVQQFAARFQQRRNELRELIRQALLDTRREEFVELAGQVHDAGDESIAELLLGLDLSGRQRELEEMQDIDGALARIREDRFGVCADCGDRIPRERLDVYPTAKRCLICQQKLETARRGGRDATPSL